MSSLHWLILVLFYVLFIQLLWDHSVWSGHVLKRRCVIAGDLGFTCVIFCTNINSWYLRFIENTRSIYSSIFYTTVYRIKQNVKSQTKKLGSFWHCRNILQWGKIDFKSMIYTNGDNYLNSGLKWWSYVRYSYPHSTLKHNFFCHVSGNCCNYRVASSTLRTLTSERSFVESSLAAMVWMCLELNLSNDNSTSSRSAPFTSFTRMLLFWKLKVQFESSWKRMAKN